MMMMLIVGMLAVSAVLGVLFQAMNVADDE